MKSVDTPLLKMEGRSGCKLEVINRDGVFFVKKISKEAEYNDRLLRQAVKQNEYYKRNPSPQFKAPQVLQQSERTAFLTWFEMPYLHGQKYSEFFERAAITEIKNVAGRFKQYFLEAFEQAIVKPVEPEIFLSKIETLRTALILRSEVDHALVAKVLAYLEKIPGNSLAIAPSHGDFTFSNMLFCEDAIYLVDFLDSFVESPLIDLVKFRQDTFFHWSLLIENQLPESRASKIIQIFKYLDTEIMKELSSNKFVQEWYNYLQVFNLLRILPYVQQHSEIEFVQNSIQRIMIP